MNILDLKTLSQRTGVSPRHLRYVLDHRLVPDQLLVDELPILGRTRVMDEISAVYIACAGSLLEAGFRSEVVRDMMSAFAVEKTRTRMTFLVFRVVVEDQLDARVEYADGRYVRWTVKKTVGEWLDATQPKTKIGDLIPRTRFELNVGMITRAVRSPDPAQKSLDS